VLLFLLTVSARGQQNSLPPTSCTTDQVNLALEQSDPAYLLARENAEMQINDLIDLMQSSKMADQIYLVPVVIHVIHVGEAVGVGSNITAAQCSSMVDGLNRDFRRLPDDGGIALGAGIDTKIQFCLKGINRVDGTSVSGYGSSGITNSNETSVKALSKWDNCCYINVWSVSEIDGNNGGAGTQGYAYFPSNPCGANAARDGVVVLYNALGNDPGGLIGHNLKTYTNMGRVMTHEMGHAFDLYHTFNGGSCTETNCGTQGDLCCDTPPHPGANTNCGTPECGGTQPVNNYMDYTGEVCQNMFTLCQKDRMRAACAGPRAGLFVAPCGCPPLLALDAGVIDITSPNGTSCGDSLCPTIEIKNFGSDTLVSVTINYQVDITNYTFAWTGSLPPNFTEIVSLPCIVVAAGSHTFTSWTTLPNGGTDMDLLNDSASTSFSTIQGSEVTLTLTTDNFGYETYWEITDCASTVLASGGNPLASPGGTQSTGLSDPGAYASNTTFTETICLADSCYCFTIYDDFGDGICCTNGSGSYLLQDQFGNTLASGGSFTSSETSSFCVTSIVPNSDFTANNTAICEGDTVIFTDLSTEDPTFWSWTFPGGTPATAMAQNPTVVYNSAGTYNVSLTTTNTVGPDTETFNGYITVNANPTLVMTGSSVNCTCTGTLEVAASSGATPYTYLWNDPSTQATPVATFLCAGTYTVTVTDANGCVNIGNATVIETGTFSAGVTSSSDITCSGANDGTATVTAAGGTAPYTYAWSNSSSSTSISSLAAGIYSVTVTDANGCTSIDNVTIAEPSTLSVSITNKNVICYRDCNGSSTAAPSGGVLPYTYQWDDPSLQNSAAAINLCAGSYNVTVTDANGCGVTASGTITESAQIILNATTVDATCGNPDGSATVAPTGGAGTYTYLWGDLLSQTTSTAVGLTSGGVTVMVTDADGCSVTATVDVGATGGPVVTIPSTSNITCSGTCNGTATASVASGTAPLTYLWSDASNQTTITATNLCAGAYSVKVTDANGCVASASLSITEPPALNGAISDSVMVSCNGFCDGSATVAVTGGTGTYTYLWSNGQTTSTATVLCAASHSVTITDANNCSTVVTVIVTQPPPLTAPTISSVTVCPCPCAGVVRVFPAGGTPPYTVIWSNGFAEQFQTKLCDGTYSVTVTDANGCTVTGGPEIITN